jgi:cation diffusion facilitator family transporter
MAATPNLSKYAWLSIAGAVATIGLKLGAFWLTNSVGLLSDALESGVNLMTAIVALIALNIATRPPDEDFRYGYSKVEYFSSGFEGAMILLAAAGIVYTAVPRLLYPEPVEQVGLGLAISVAASAINFGIARVLKRAGQRYGSITLEADAGHLMTDVLTTAGVLVGVLLVSLTGFQQLDALVALAVAGNILFTGVGLLRRAGRGLLDAALPAAEQQRVDEILASFAAQGVEFHAVLTRTAARRGFVSLHLLVPGAWSVQRGHELAEAVEAALQAAIPRLVVLIHLEPLEDPASWDDPGLERR